MSPARGTQVSEAVLKPDIAKAVREGGDNTIVKKGLSIGDGTHGTAFGRHDAQYAVYRTKAADTTNVIIPHNLGRVPNVVQLVSQESTQQAAPNSSLTVALVNRNQWTATTFRISVAAVTGNIPDVILTFLVG